MALPMVHLGAAQAAIKKLDICDLPSYYLGSIAPDGAHMLDHYEPEDKNRSHLGTRASRDPAAVGEFLKRLPEFSNRDYALGYAVHVLTDIIWNESLLVEYDRRYKADPSPELDWNRAYYSDTDQIDLRLYDILPGREAIWRELEQAKAIDLPGVLLGRAADLWNIRTRNWYLEPRDYEFPIRWFSLEEVLHFLPEAGEYSAEHCKKFL